MTDFDSKNQDATWALMRWALREAAVVLSEDAQLLAGQLEGQRNIPLTGPQALRCFASSALRKGMDAHDLSFGVVASQAARLLATPP